MRVKPVRPKLRPRGRRAISTAPLADSSRQETEVSAPIQEHEQSKAVNPLPIVENEQIPEKVIDGNDAQSLSDRTAGASDKKEEHNSLIDAFRSIPPKYTGYVKLLRWGNTSSAGMTVSFELLDVDELDTHPFKGLRAARGSKTEGQRMRIVVMHSETLSDKPGEPIYSGDSILTWWAEDCHEGMKTTIKLDDGIDGAGQLHPFDGMRHGKANGDILSLVAWAIDDEEQPETPKARRSKRSFAELTPTAQTHILSRDPKFFEWLRGQELVFIKDDALLFELATIAEEDPISYCEHIIKVWCQISSRSEFSQEDDQGSNARNRWKVMLDRYNSARGWG